MHWVHIINENFEQNILIEFENEKNWKIDTRTN